MINKELFYGRYRKLFGSMSKQSTVLSLDAIINCLDELDIPIAQMAYILATVRHECGPNMLPIVENLNYSARRLTIVWPSRFPTIESAIAYANNPEKLGNKVYGGRLGNGQNNGYKYRGRGFVQITGYVNYKKFSDILNIDLVNDPDMAMDVDVGIKILVMGMVNGIFTGKKLDNFIFGSKVDYYNARSIINADKSRVGASIESDAKKFQEILKNAQAMV